MKTTKQSSPHGNDAKKNIGRQRHLVAVTFEMVGRCITSVIVQNRDDGMQTPEMFRSQVISSRILWADREHFAMDERAWFRLARNIELMTHRPLNSRFSPKRLGIEQTLDWLDRSRRLAKNFERTCESIATLLFLTAVIQFMAKRLA